jgi:hypothetical protein
MIAGKLWAVSLAGLLGMPGCAAPSAGIPAQKPPALEDRTPSGLAADPALLAAHARARGEDAQADGAPGMFEHAQVRVSRLGQEALKDQDGPGVALRVKLDRPFRTSVLAESLRRRGDTALWLAHAKAAEREALRCEQSAAARAALVREEAHAAFRVQATQALAWAEALKGAGEVERSVALDTLLSVRRALVERALHTVLQGPAEGLGELPDVLAEPGAPLDLSRDSAFAQIAAAHPEVLSHASAAERYRAEALAEKRARLPWLEFVQVDQDTGRDFVRGLSARAAIGMPLDDGAKGRAARATHFAEAERHEADATAQLLTDAALAALAELHDVEARAKDHRALLETATAAEAVAKQLVTERRGLPAKAVSLLDAAADAKEAVLEAQERAAQAACTLKLTTGRTYGQWPRTTAH